MADKVNGSGTHPEPLTDAQKRYADQFREWLLSLSRADFNTVVEKVLQPLKFSYYNRGKDPEEQIPNGKEPH